MMDLYILHGRKTPDEDLQEWGPNGPRLKGVTGMHETYGTGIRVYFKDRSATLEAQHLTGWEEWDENCLQMRWHDDCVVCERDGVKMFYGDWGLIAPEAE